VDECGAGIRRSLGEGGYASAGFTEEFQDATAVRPWSFTFKMTSVETVYQGLVGHGGF
jgi:hypothetical protein